MEFEVGSVLEGKVTAITKFGAFVTFAPGKSGLVHISEIANAYVNNISDFLAEGQDVKVKIISIDEAGRINLSIKQALPEEQRPAYPRRDGPRPPRGDYAPAKRFSQDDNRPRPQRDSTQSRKPYPSQERQAEKPADASFEDKLKRFMQDSDSKISNLYADKRPTRRRPK